MALRRSLDKQTIPRWCRCQSRRARARDLREVRLCEGVVVTNQRKENRAFVDDRGVDEEGKCRTHKQGSRTRSPR